MKIEFLVVLALYILGGTIIAVISKRFFQKNLRDYYVGGGRLGSLLTAGTYAATTYSAFMMIGLVGLTYATGVGALGFELLYLAATVFLLSTVGYEVWRKSKEYNWIAPSQMLGDLYGSRSLSILVSTIYLFAMLPYLAAQIQGLKAMFNYGGLSEDWALIISSILVYLWIAIAGLWSVALTDLYQGLIMLISGLAYFAWVLLVFTPSTGVSLNDVFIVLGENGYLGLTSFWSLPVFLAYTIPWVFFAVTNPQVVVRLYMPRDEKAYRRGVFYFFIYGFLYTLIVVVVGLVVRGLALMGFIPSDLPRDSVTPWLLSRIHPLLGSLIAISVIAAAISTANSIVLAISGSLLVSTNKHNGLTLARIIDAILVVVAALIARANIGFIVDLSVLTSVILLPLAPVTITGLYINVRNKYAKTSALIAIIIGVSIATYYAYTLGPRRAFIERVFDLPISLVVLLSSTIVLLAGVLIGKKLAPS